METIEQKVKSVIANDESFDGQEVYKKFKQANEHHDALVRMGVTSRRGYCLKTISDVPTFKYDKNLM
jgi:hypothetical protein